MEIVYYNPLTCKNKPGVNKLNENIDFKIFIRCDCLVSKVTLVLRYEKDNSTKYLDLKLSGYDINYFIYSESVSFDKVGLYWYHFKVETNHGIIYVNKSDIYLSSINSNEEFPLTIIEKEIGLNKDYLGGIIYQIFVDRFNKVGEPLLREGFVYRDDWGGDICKNTTDRTLLNYEIFGGNLKGIIDKLDYLRELGVTTIYLSPISLASSNHKYDTSDYSKIDPLYGDEKKFKELVCKAKDRKIGIILDGVFNHIGSDSIYFNKNNRFDEIGAYNSKDSKYYDWFDFRNWPDDYRCWWDITTLPSVNQGNKDYQEYIEKIIHYYMGLGILGYRLDVVDEIQHELLTKICNSIYEVKSNALVIGEVWEDASTKISYGNRRGYFLGTELNSVMNYPLKDALLEYVLSGDLNKFIYCYRMIENNYPDFVKHNLMNLIDSHDTRRIISILKEKDDWFNRLKIISGLQFTFYGVPSIFYGDEVGIEEDPPDFSRKCYPWGKEDKLILKWYKTLAKIRKHKIFKTGSMEVIKADNGILVYKRKDEKEEIIVISNLSDSEYMYKSDKRYKSLLDNKIKDNIIVKNNEIDILIKWD